MSVEVMVFSKRFISGGKGLLLHVTNSHSMTDSNMLAGPEKLLFASCLHPGPIEGPHPRSGPMGDWAHPLGIPMLLHGASSHELLTVVVYYYFFFFFFNGVEIKRRLGISPGAALCSCPGTAIVV